MKGNQLPMFVECRYPNHAGKTAFGKEANALGSNFYGSEIAAGQAQFIAQGLYVINSDVPQETKCQMKMIWSGPANRSIWQCAAQFVLGLLDFRLHRVRGSKGDEQAMEWWCRASRGGFTR